MATKKISALTAKGANLATTDLLEISEYDGVSAYTTKSITGANIIDKVRNVLFYANAAAFPVTGDSDTLYIAKDADTINVWNGASYAIVNPPATEKNISTNDVVFPANSTTDFAGYKATFDNAEVKIVSDANTSGDVPFQITQADGTTNILKITGDKVADLNGEFKLGDGDYSRIKLNNSQAGKQVEIGASVANFNTITLGLGGTGEGSFFNTNGAAWFTNQNLRFDTANKSNIYVNNGGLGLGLNGRNGLNDDIFIDNNGHVLMANLPTYADEAAAVTGGLATNKLYKTATGELRIKL